MAQLTTENFEQLKTIQTLSRKAQVSFSLNYCEQDDSWYFTVSSAAPSENFVSKNRSFDGAVEYVVDWLKSLTAQQWARQNHTTKRREIMKTVLAVVVGGKNFICQDLSEAARLFEFLSETREAKFSTLDASLPLTVTGKTRPSIEFIDVQEAV